MQLWFQKDFGQHREWQLIRVSDTGPNCDLDHISIADIPYCMLGIRLHINNSKIIGYTSIPIINFRRCRLSVMSLRIDG